MSNADSAPEIASQTPFEQAQAEIAAAAQHVRALVMAEADSLPDGLPDLEVMSEVTDRQLIGSIVLGQIGRPTHTIKGLVVDRWGAAFAGEDKAVVLTPGGLYSATGLATGNSLSRLVLKLFPSSYEETNLLWLKHGPKAIKRIEELKAQSEAA